MNYVSRHLSGEGTMASKEVEHNVRKLRKKLRQIENLESTARDLTPDEVAKV